MNQLKLADQAYQDRRYAEAEEAYLRYAQGIDGIAHKTQAESRAAACRMRLERYEEAGDLLLSVVQRILDAENTLLSYGISKLLKLACLCYLISGHENKFKSTLSNDRLLDHVRTELQNRDFQKSSCACFDEKFLLSKLNA